MDLFSLAYSTTLFLIPFILYLLFTQDEKLARYNKPTWFAFVKKILAINVIKRYMRKSKTRDYINKWEAPIKLTDISEEDVHLIFGTDQEGNSIYIKFATRLNKFAEVSIQLRLHTGQIYQLPNEPQVLLCSLQKREWRAKGLTIECVEPCKLYRVTYNGFVKNNNVTEHLRFNLIWTAASEPIYFPSDYERSLFSDALSREPWRDGDWLKLLGDRVGYDQYGCLYGEIYGSMLQYKRRTVNIPTCRKRYNGTAERFCLYRELGIFICTEDGTLINIGTRSIKRGCSHLRYGTVLYNDGTIMSIKSNDINLEEIGEYGKLPEAFALLINTRRSSMKCIFHVQFENQTDTYSNEPKGWKLINVMAECDVNQQQGRTFIMSWYSKKGHGVALPKSLIASPKMENLSEKLIAHYDEEECRCHEIAGRKGSAFGNLSTIISNEFSIPDGLILTAQAFQKQIDKNKKLREIIIDMVLNFNDDQKLRDLCQKTVQLFETENINEAISKAILLETSRIKAKAAADKSVEKIEWIIRTSDVNDDFKGFSRTTKNDQYIECASIADILKCIMSYWGSFYSYEKVRYRLSRGLSIRCNIALLIQRKVDCDLHGSVIPYNPTNKDITKIFIDVNKNHENSTSQSTSILKRTYKNELSIQEKGSDEIPEDLLLKLGRFSVYLEERFGSAKCLKWTLCNEKIYILQIRDADFLTEWTDKELEHELDDPILSEKEIYTKENVKEVLPDAITVLSSTVVRSLKSNSWERLVLGKANKCVNLAFVSIYHHIFINALNMTWKIAPEKIGTWTHISDLIMFGYPITTELVKQRAEDKNGRQNICTKLAILADVVHIVTATEKSYRTISKLSKEDINFHRDMTPSQIYRTIQEFTKIVDSIVTTHYTTWKANTFYHLVTLRVLIGDDQEFTPDHYHDIALIFSSCKNVITSDIPRSMEKIASYIRKTNRAMEFSLLNTEDCVEWMEDYAPDAFKAYRMFMQKHGYRSFKEYELCEDSWAMNPTTVISLIQKISTFELLEKTPKSLSISSTLKKLRTRTGKSTKLLLKILMHQSRKTISLCELTKSEVARAIDKLRVAYKQLAEKLVANGNIPDASLIFHLTKYEVGKICEARNPSLVMKASRRKALFEDWNEYKFPDWLFLSYPTDLHQVPIMAKGVPICTTEVAGRCCCANSLDELDQLQTGDILITHSIDIRWYPYFPILAGIVTESGGFISHGIVAAREYGLPCLTGVKDATKNFNTGDMIVLSGKTGTIQLQNPQSQF